MDHETLISTVEGHKCIYDKSDNKYKNALFKENAWGDIAGVTGMSKDDCKKRWSYLRENFCKELKKRDLPSGSGSSLLTDEWPYLEALMFLKQFIQPRNTKTNHFSEGIEEIDETGEIIIESPAPKRTRADPFNDSCNIFKEIVIDFKEKHTPAEKDVYEQFLATLLMMFKGLPELVQNNVRLHMLT